MTTLVNASAVIQSLADTAAQQLSPAVCFVDPFMTKVSTVS